MKKKDIIILSALANSGLLAILLVSAITSKESDLSPSSSSKIAEAILEENVQGMVPKEVVIQPEKIVHKLPQLEKEEKKNTFFDVIVKAGDSLERIAKLYNTSVEEIISLNNLSNSFLRVGQVLKVPKVVKVEPIVKEEVYYIVKPGDNPWTISMKHHIKVEELLRINNLDEHKAKRLRPGDKLKIR